MEREQSRPAGAEGSGGATLRIAMAAWTVFGLVFASAGYWEVRTHGHSAVLIFAFVLLVWWGWAAATPVVAWLGRRAPLVPFSWTASLIHAAAAAILGLLHVAWWTALAVWLRPFDDMGVSQFWTGLVGGLDKLFFEVMIYLAVVGTTYAVDAQRRLRQREIAALQLEKSLAHASLHALELQMQPHFLFNTLHAIGGLVRKGRSSEAVDMIAGLSDLLRYSLDNAGQHLVPLDREVEVLRRYLDIQRIRFPDRLAVEIHVPDELGRACVPAMMLQPLAENAIRHGIEPASARGRIEVRAWRDGDELRIELCNSGILVDARRAGGRSSDGIGLQNTRARLEQLYGTRHRFTLANRDGGVVASLTLPFEEEPRR
ncbi:MAG TPA: histidine kinase [Kofleriaceae bacterium]|nr:histidine kinase [Kofleriaceae bacterium]